MRKTALHLLIRPDSYRVKELIPDLITHGFRACSFYQGKGKTILPEQVDGLFLGNMVMVRSKPDQLMTSGTPYLFRLEVRVPDISTKPVKSLVYNKNGYCLIKTRALTADTDTSSALLSARVSDFSSKASLYCPSNLVLSVTTCSSSERLKTEMISVSSRWRL